MRFRLFPKKQEQPAKITLNLSMPVSFEELEGSSLGTIVNALQGSDEGLNQGALINVTRRLIEIGYYEHVDDADRVLAHRILEIVVKAVEENCQDNPEQLTAYQHAYHNQLSMVEDIGYQSLAYKISETAPEDVVKMIIDPINAHLITDFARETLSSERASILKALIVDRRPAQNPSDVESWLANLGKNGNGVVASWWLCIIRDSTTVRLLAPEERIDLSAALDDYHRARARLLMLDVLRPGGEGLPMEPAPDKKLLRDFIYGSLLEQGLETLPLGVPQVREKLDHWPRECREALLTLVYSIRLFIWKRSLSGLYGQLYWDDLRTSIDLPSFEQTDVVVTRIEAIYDGFLKHEGQEGFDTFILADNGDVLFDRSLSEARLDEMVTVATNIIRGELFGWFLYSRYLIRCAIHGVDKGLDVQLEDVVV